MTAIHISAQFSQSRWANGKPLSSEILPDGRTVHLMEDGRKITVSTPTYMLHYLSTWVGSAEGETYEVPIAISGAHDGNGFYEAWNFDINELRNYSFDKTVKLVNLETGEVLTGEEVKRDSIYSR